MENEEGRLEGGKPRCPCGKAIMSKSEANTSLRHLVDKGERGLHVYKCGKNWHVGHHSIKVNTEGTRRRSRPPARRSRRSRG